MGRVQMQRHEPVNLDSGRTGKHIPLEVRFNIEKDLLQFLRHSVSICGTILEGVGHRATATGILLQVSGHWNQSKNPGGMQNLGKI